MDTTDSNTTHLDNLTETYFREKIMSLPSLESMTLDENNELKKAPPTTDIHTYSASDGKLLWQLFINLKERILKLERRVQLLTGQ